MSSIQEILASISDAVFGKDVRQAIHDGVEMAYNKADNAETSAAAAADAASGSQNSAAASAQAASNSASSASNSANQAEQYKNEAFHTTPAGYEAFVGEVKSSLDYLVEAGVKNLLKIVNYSSTTLSHGVTISINDDDSITLDGTASEWFFVNLNFVSDSFLSFPAGEYIASGAAPSGVTLNIRTDSGNIATVRQGDAPFTIPSTATMSYARLEITANTVFNNLTIYPMVRDACVADNSYKPFALSNVLLTQYMKVHHLGKGFSSNADINTAITNWANTLPLGVHYAKLIGTSATITNGDVLTIIVFKTDEGYYPVIGMRYNNSATASLYVGSVFNKVFKGFSANIVN